MPSRFWESRHPYLVVFLLLVSLERFAMRGGWLDAPTSNLLFDLISVVAFAIILLGVLQAFETRVRGDSRLLRCAVLGLTGLVFGYFWLGLRLLFPANFSGEQSLESVLFYLGAGALWGIATGFMKRHEESPR
jgi:hypothetical protein